ncbi:hypothetical protein RSOLAG1IB_02995 [Rhizoctonia solani AG-1 IB]|uniref:Uncharacterized protein n=1 Tax=Thanatephorus cucumeris (strain AG1-IB / isolate 7/3/14) TaxID=1108050 RepID=A0A0B7FMW5_THACB|nr:hypothetical protein RSOLAG1IB_02995 [Rhizoctonia solani AG-1 IB]
MRRSRGRQRSIIRSIHLHHAVHLTYWEHMTTSPGTALSPVNQASKLPPGAMRKSLHIIITTLRGVQAIIQRTDNTTRQ